MNSILILAWVATALYIITFVLFCFLHITKSDYTVSRNPVSDYGVGQTARLFQVYALSGTLGAIALTCLFYFSPQQGFPSLVANCMLLMVVSRVGVAAFQTDLEKQKRTVHGILHNVCAIGTFGFAYTAIANATEPALALRQSPLLNLLLITFKYLALIALGFTVMTMPRPLRRFFGLAERVFIVSMIVWFLTMSLWFVNANVR